MNILPIELISKVISFLPLIDRVKCELVDWKFNSICKGLWLLQTSIDDNELPPIKWITEFQTILPDLTDQARIDLIRWKLTLKCPRIKQIFIDDDKISSTYFVQRLPYIEHIIVSECYGDFAILSEAKSLKTITFEGSDCNEYQVVIKYLPSSVTSIIGPSICDPWVNNWDEFFDHSDSVRFENLRTLTVVISLQTMHQLNNILKLEQLIHVRFLMGDDYDNHFLIKYLELRGSKLKRLELYQPNHHISCRNVYAAVTNNCNQLQELGLKGYFHGSDDGHHFEKFLYDFKSLVAVTVNIHRALNREEVVTVCDNNRQLRKLTYSLYMRSISTRKLKNCKEYCDRVKSYVADYNGRHPERGNVICDTSQTVKKIMLNCS